MSASNIVMNCDDLRNQIFSYAFHKIPEECWCCGVGGCSVDEGCPGGAVG
jgi:hypothetical protein